jgi:Fe-S-cluster containining protein
MPLKIADPNVRFECNSCTRCCRHELDVMLDEDKVAGLDAVDWGAKYAEMAGQPIYRKVKRGQRQYLALTKRDDNACVFLDHDGLCRIQKQIGFEAKPRMCRQFPLISRRHEQDERVSVSFGCPSIQKGNGPLLSEQMGMVEATCQPNHEPVRSQVPLVGDRMLGPELARLLTSRLEQVFDPRQPGQITERFVQVLALVKSATLLSDEELDQALTRGTLARPEDFPEFEPFEKAAVTPMPSRMLFAMTLFKDTLPASAAQKAALGFFRRMMLVPKLMSLASQRGGYASRLLRRNVKLDVLMNPANLPQLAARANTLLCQYIRSRLWQQLLVGGRLSIVAGLHQHILDISAVVFYAIALSRPEAQAPSDLDDLRELGRAEVAEALSLVELNLANQSRVYEEVLTGWLTRELDTLANAWHSLRMIRVATPVRTSS